ncbi:hypothetical protein FA95DRAFT_1611777, partial [Auriscalpium vulgare]
MSAQPYPWSQSDLRHRPISRHPKMQPPPHSLPHTHHSQQPASPPAAAFAYHHRTMPSAAPLARHISPTPSHYPLIYDPSSPYSPHMPTSTSGASQGNDFEYFDSMGEMSATFGNDYEIFDSSNLMGWSNDVKKAVHSPQLSHDDRMRFPPSPNATFNAGGMSPQFIKPERSP